jgi:cytochrome c5
MRAFWPAASGLGVLILGIALQPTVPTPLKPHVQALSDAKSLSGKVTMTPIGGAPSKFSFTYSRSGSFKIEGTDGSVYFDGKNLTEYSAASKTYKVIPADKADWKKAVTETRVWAWSAFFNPALMGEVASATKGRSRTVAGEALTELALRFTGAPTRIVTLMTDAKGIAKGFTFREGDKESIVLAQELVMSATEPEASLFAFVPPAGAVLAKIDDPATSAPKYADVQAIFNRSCMPCHNSQTRRSGYDLTSYEAVTGNAMGVRPNSPDDSMILKSVRGVGARLMPQGRPRLSQGDIDTIANWIKAGAKKD